MNKKLYYVHDPMCSWCFAFSITYQKLIESLPEEIDVVRLLGGLAPDSDEPMPASTREMVIANWERIAQDLGVEFNYDFWEKCQPRRSTYPACRAVIAARDQGNNEKQGEEFDISMTHQIQQAYYRQARNPSNNDTLIELAGEIGLDQDWFSEQLAADRTQQRLNEEIAAARKLGITGFPSLIMRKDKQLELVPVNYTNAETMLAQILD